MERIQSILKLAAWHFRGGFWRVLSRFTWELPQTILGFNFGMFTILRKNLEAIEYFEGAIVLRAVGAKRFWGGVCMGTVIVADARVSAEVNNPLFMHEFGHVLQSRSSGPLYLFKYGLPSLLSATTSRAHNLHPVEQDANRRSFDFFQKFKSFREWPDAQHPILPSCTPLRSHWYEYIPPIFPLKHIWDLMRYSRS